ncbi:MAG: hypothetical protein LBI31_07570, partial [Zoogloeaceae bacterium]|nr:hypothetical protein [Zoogloeaceae bacterium]
LIGADEILELDIDPFLEGKIKLPYFKRYYSDRFEWVTYESPFDSTSVKARYSAPPSPPNFSLRVKTTGQGAVIQLVQNATGQVLYEQELRMRLRGSRLEYCPDKRKGYYEALLRALGRDVQGQKTGKRPAAAPPPPLHTETAYEPCDLGEEDIDGIEGLRAWDGRQVILELFLRERKGFCSSTYIAMASVGDGPAGLRSDVHVFDRYTLQPLAVFPGGRCDKPCPEVSKDVVTGIRISNDNVTVETTQGDIETAR